MNKNKSSIKKNKRKKIIKIRLTDIVIILAILALVFGLIKIFKDHDLKKNSFEITPEIARSREYDIVHAGEENTSSEFVKFDAFFLKDLDGDGEADSIRGTCNRVGKEDTLYMDLKILNNGYFKDGQITINSSNFYFNTTIAKDDVFSANYISNDTEVIKLNKMPNGSQKLITGMVRSGDYTKSDSKTQAIGNDTNKYSMVNSITFTGTHVDDDNHETKIEKTINFNVDWYGETKAAISVTNIKNEVNDLDELVEGNNINLNFEIKTEEQNNELILKSSNIEGTMPELNGYKATSVEITGDGITYTYNEETGIFTAKREAVKDDNETIIGIANTSSYKNKRYNTYNVKAIYPKEAYENMEENSIDLFIPVKTWYEGYNNPNDEFDNPYVSNIAEATIAARWIKYEGYAYRFDIYVGEIVSSPYSRYVVSKEKPLKIYNNISEEEKQDYYEVRWRLSRGRQTSEYGTIMKETKNGEAQVSDNFIKTDSSSESMENLTTNVGIYFTGADSMLEEDGWIKVYDDINNELIETFTKDNWNKYKESNPYYYEKSIKHIRVETSSTNPNAVFNVYNIKELDDKYITDNYEKEEFDKLQYIKSTLNGTFGTNSSTVTNKAHYEAPLSIANINISKPTISTQERAENQIITIETETNNYNEQKWKNGTFLVKIPEEIIEMQINSVTVNKENVSILGYDLYEEDGIYYIKILTENENEGTYKISIDCNMTPDPRNNTVTRKVELYAINEQGIEYYYNGKDIYDLDGDLNKEEIVNHTQTSINLISPNDLLTNQIALKYDDKESVTISPRVAKVEKSQRTAEIDVNLTNNYSQDVTDIVIQGVIPFEGNKFVIGNRELGSTFSSNITDAGIIVPDDLKDYATVYYSTEAEPTKDLNDANNKWKKAEDITNWNDIKTYIIDLGNYVLSSKDNKTFKYTVNLPEGVDYNEVTYSEHAIYFSLMTDAGKYYTYTASNKLGLMIAKQYDLEIEKFQQGTTKNIQGVTFKITEEGQEDSKIKVTDSDGILTVYGLYAEKTYIIKEIKTSNDYVLNGEEIKIYTYTDENGNLYVTYKNDNGSYTKLEDKYNWLKFATSTKQRGDEYKVKLQLENEPKARLKIVKKNGDNLLSGIKFKLTGKGKNNAILMTNTNGEISTSGLYLNEEYTLEETKASGYYLPNNHIKLKIKNDFSLEISGDGIANSRVTTNNEIPTINLELENEKIPEYSLKITKKEKDTENVLKGTQFKLTGEDKNENTIYTTDENGIAQIDNLYQFVEGKNIEAKYTLKEIYATEGYILNDTPLVFKVKKNNDTVEFQIESGSIRGDAEIDYTDPNNPIIKITLDNEPIFTLTKVDEETNEPLEGVEFKITDMDDNTVTDVNGKDLSKVTTDENGKIRLSLGQGLYKAIETKQLPGYENPELYTGIGIGESKSATTALKFDGVKDELENITFHDITRVDNEVIVVGNSSHLGKVVKYDLNGNLIWENTDKTHYYLGVTTVDNGIIAVGSSGEVVKYDLDGNVIWENTEKTYRYNGVTTVDNGIIAVGSAGKVVKYDLDGNVIWENTEKTYTYNRVTTVDNGVIAVGSAGKVVKYDLNGNVLWENTEKTYKYNGVTTVDNGVIAVGNSGKIVKYDLNGDVIWENTEKQYNYYGVTKVDDGVIVGAGAAYNRGKVLKLDLNGDIVWESTALSNTINYDFYNYCGMATVSDGIIAVSTQGQIVKYDLNGNVIWKNTKKSYKIMAMAKVEDGIIVVAGYGQVAKCDLKGNLIWENTEKKYQHEGITVVEDGVITVGESINHVTKYDFNGNIVWENNEKSYKYKDIITVEDGVVALTDKGRLLKYSIDGAFLWETPEDIYTNGITSTEGGIVKVTREGMVQKYDLDGNIVWKNTKKTYNYTTAITVEKGIIALGSSGEVVKYDLSGNIVWENKEKSLYYSAGTAVENGIIVATGYGQIVKYDLDGNIVAENTEYIKDSRNGYTRIIEIEDERIVTNDYEGLATYKNVIIEPEIPEAQSVIVKNKKKQVKITTEVKGTGGTISGQNDSPYEEVVYGKDSVKEIKATPDTGYSVVRITVNGEQIDFTENNDGTVTLSKFINMEEDKHIVVEFSDSVSSIEVNHYLWKENTGITTTKVADSSTQKGIVDEKYTTSPKYDIEYEIVTNKDYYGKAENENEVEQKTGETLEELGYSSVDEFNEDYYIPLNSVGKFKTTLQTVNYYYKEKTYTLTVKHLLEGTEESVPSIAGDPVQDEVTEGYKKNDEYETSRSNKIDYEKYELVETPENAEGTIEEDTVVKYYYRQKEHVITTKVQEHEETDSFGNRATVRGGEITGEGQSPYETVKHGEDSVKEIKAVPDENYEVKTITVNGTSIEFTPEDDGTVILSKFVNMTEDKEVIVEFRKIQGKVIVHHYIEGTTEKIDLRDGTKAEDEVKTGDVGNIYATKPNENAATKYSIVSETPERASGTYINGTIEVTYYYKVRQIQVEVTKVWDDNNNRLGIRPTSVKVNLKASIINDQSEREDVTESVIPSTVEKQATLSGTSLTHKWENLDQYTSNSKEIIYDVEEEALTGNLGVVYSSEVTRDNTNPYKFTITNKYTKPTEKISYVVNKIWDDNSNENNKRPEELVLEIYSVGANNTKTNVSTYTLNTLSEATHTFELDRYDEKGNEINYIAEEKEKTTGDLKFYTQTQGERQEATVGDKKVYTSEITNKFEVPDEKVNVKVTKEWKDDSNENEKRPESIKLVLYKVENSSNVKTGEYILRTPSSANTFNYTFENLSKYDEHGNEIEYIVDEEEINEDGLKFYSKQVTETTDNNFKITNTFTVPEEKIEIEAEKVWSEQNDTQKQRRPSSITLKLMNGNTEVSSDVVNESNGWKVTFKNLARYNSKGNIIQYKLDEEEVTEGDLKFYTKTGGTTLVKVDDNKYKLSLTNTFTKPNDTIELKTTKVWDDENGKDRLNAIKFVLEGNGETYEQRLTSSNEDRTNSNNWIYTFKNLPKYNANGEEITYTLREEEVNRGDFKDYISNVNGYSIENKLIIKDTKIEKTGTEEITRLDEAIKYKINYEAKVDSGYTGTAKVVITDTLPYEIDTSKEYDLNGGTYNAGNKEIKWEENCNITEGKITISKEIRLVYKDLPLNIDKFTNKVKGELQLENELKEEVEDTFDTEVNFKRNITITKVWKGDTEEVSERPENAIVELLKNGVVEKTETLDSSKNWKATFEGLQKYDETTREEIEYTVREKDVPEGYYAETTNENVANNMIFRVINNKYGTIKITKVDKLDNSKKIGGAEFTLTKLKEENGRWIEDSTYAKKVMTTSSEQEKLGIAEFKELEYGKYRLKETKAPEGYELLRDSVDIDVSETTPNVKTTIQNKVKNALPDTGAYAKVLMVLVGFILLIVAYKIKIKNRIQRRRKH